MPSFALRLKSAAGSVLSCALIFGAGVWSLGAAEGEFVLNKETQRVTADLDNVPLHTALERVASATGWEIQCPDSVSRSVSVKFKDLPLNDALSRVVGEFNYTVIQSTNGVQLRVMAPGQNAASGGNSRIIGKSNSAPPRPPPSTGGTSSKSSPGSFSKGSGFPGSSGKGSPGGGGGFPGSGSGKTYGGKSPPSGDSKIPGGPKRDRP